MTTEIRPPFFPRGKGPLISLLCPTRGTDPDLLEGSLRSLFSTARDASQLEVLLKLYAHTEASSVAVLEKIKLEFPQVKLRWYVTPQRNGYYDLHHFFNTLATMATGDWLMFWEDGWEMLENNWDARIDDLIPGYTWAGIGDTCALVADGGITAWRRKLTEVVGRITGHWTIDPWLSYMVRFLEIWNHVEFKRSHIQRHNNARFYNCRCNYQRNIAKVSDLLKVHEYLKSKYVWTDAPIVKGWYVIKVNCNDDLDLQNVVSPFYYEGGMDTTTMPIRLQGVNKDHSVSWHLVNPA